MNAPKRAATINTAVLPALRPTALLVPSGLGELPPLEEVPVEVDGLELLVVEPPELELPS